MSRSWIYVIVAACLALAACDDDKDGKSSEPEHLGDVLQTFGGDPAYQEHGGPMPDEGCERLRWRPIGPLHAAFNDSNSMQLVAAKKVGIVPVRSLRQAWHLRRPLVRIASCPEYFVDTLTHSYPYLVPEAADLLAEIGHRFNDSLWARGGGPYRIHVTSVTRTPTTVGRLRRINRNAVEESTHQYGTTFDLSQFKFIYDGPQEGQPARTADHLRALLAEILYDLRAEGRCYVKYERRQACFHITARPQE